MSVQKLSTPGRTATAGAECKWIASDNTIDFVFQRKDHTITGVVSYNSGNQVRFNISSGQNYSTRQGQDIYISDVLDKYTGTHEIYAGGYNFIIIDEPFTGNTIGYINDTSRWPNYYLDIEVYEYREGATLGFLQFVPSDSGEIRCNLAEIIKDNLILNTRYKYELVNKREEDWSISFGFRYSEVFRFDGTNFIATTALEEGSQWYAAKAAIQIGEQYGQNLRAYEIYPEAISNEALFLSEGDIPTYWMGYPFSLSFLFGEQATGGKHQRVVEQLDINKTLIAATNETDYMAQVDRGYVNRLSLRKTAGNYGLTGWDSEMKYLRIWIEETDEPLDDLLGGGGGSGGGGTNSGPGGGNASLLPDDGVGG